MAMKNSYFIKTFGCQQNKSDSERIAADYQARGFLPAKTWRSAGEVIVNTCAVRQSAEDRVRGFLLNLEKYFQAEKRAKPKLILTGCMIYRGKGELFKLLPMLDEVLPFGEVGFNSQAVRRDRYHAWIPISTGCNSFCTYCIVPYARGREKSRPFQDILAEAHALAAQGYRELTLLGMNVNSWGLEKVGIGLRKRLMDKQGQISPADIPRNQSQYFKPHGIRPFVKLLRAISEIKGIQIIRFLTSNPWDFSDDLIAEIAENKKIDRYLHLPVQSGSNKILERMNRGYTRQNYLNLLKKLRRQIPDVVIGTDLIVGFPEETEADFQATVSLAKIAGWKVAFVARYSPRPGTASWRLYPDDITPSEKKRRWEILDKIINKDHLEERPKIV